jgi:hypothetical protein
MTLDGIFFVAVTVAHRGHSLVFSRVANGLHQIDEQK